MVSRKRIKNDMVHHDKPTTLAGLRKARSSHRLVFTGNTRLRYLGKTTTLGSSSHKNENKSSDNTKSDKGKEFFTVQAEELKPVLWLLTEQREAPRSRKKSNPDLSSKLGEDGKLTQQEKAAMSR